MPSIVSLALALSAAVTFSSAIPHSGHSHMHLHARNPGQSNNGACGGDLGFTCAPGYCCSSWGYCGKSPAYCGNGCQSEYGTCSGGGSGSTSVSKHASSTVISVKAAQTVTVSPVGGTSSVTAKTAYHSHSSWAGAPGWSSSASSPAESSAPPVSDSSVWTSSSAAAAPSTTLLTSTLPSAATTYSPTSTVAPASSAPAPSSYSAPATTSSAPASSPSTGGGSGSDTYKLYTGDGTTGGGWPSQNDWVSWDSMWSSNLDIIKISCAQWSVSNNSDDENDQLQQAIQDVANSASMDPRFVLAVVMQESKGCVRAPTTNYGVENPGLMQSHDGTGSCNNGAVQDPCPSSEITQMIKDGTTGTAAGDGLEQTMSQCGATDVSKYYKAARMYNSGSIAASGNLDDGIATHCYASDIANRLTGWVKAETACNLD